MIDLAKIKELYKIGKDLSLKDIQVLISAAKSSSFAKGTYLIKEGSTNNEVFYIREGLVRCFHVNEKGEEITFALLAEHQLVASADLILFNLPSRFYFEALENLSVFSINYDILQEIVSKNRQLEANRKHILQKLLKSLHSRVESFVLYSPEKRYQKFILDNPTLINRVPDKYIANVLGITPVSLSRIRKRISLKNKK